MLILNYSLFITFGITDAVDIILVAIMLYQLYKMVKGTAAVNVFIGLALIYIVWIIVRAFELKLLGSILGKFINVGVIILLELNTCVSLNTFEIVGNALAETDVDCEALLTVVGVKVGDSV